MPQIAFFIELKKNQETIEGADFNLGNPGIGGTPFLFLLTIKELNRLYGDQFAVLITDTYFHNLKIESPIGFAEDESGAIKYCEENGVNYLVINANSIDKVAPQIWDTRINIMIWAHNTLTAKRQRIAAMTKSIKWVICVSESQYKNMRDTPCFYKCTYINNILPSYFYENSTLSDYSEDKVIYIGSLVPQKGAHNLIEIWRHVEKRCPNAHLYVFGGARVWNNNIEVGNTSPADVYYDRVLRRRIKKLRHPENIHFMGARGWDNINSFISNFKIGVVNPSHYMRDETFCLSAIEMSAHGLPVISRQRKDGLNTTIIHEKTGYLEKYDRQIAKRIINLLSDSDLCNSLGMEGRKLSSDFLPHKEIKKWKDLLEEPSQNQTTSSKACLSKDAILLRMDLVHKLLFTIESRKILDLIRKRIKG